jgi:WhiB family redox-sensing transcriptional regulator
MDWHDSAKCRGMDPDLFFPVGNGSGGASLLQIDEAKAVCGSCPVARQCLAWALNAVTVEGIWGGTTEAERRSMLRRGAPGHRDTASAAA